MEMLREWNGGSLNPIFEVLEKFEVTAPELTLLKYEVLSPDSFIWVLSSGGNRYCLYAEDYAPSLQHVRKMMKDYGSLSGKEGQYDLKQVKRTSNWEDSSPVASADVYTPPIKPEEFMKFALPSGHDFIFLGETTEG